MKSLVKGSLACRLAALVEILGLLLATVWVARAYIAQVVSRRPTVSNFQLAIKLDPGNAEYHLQLGRLFEYSPTSEQPQRATAEFQRAAALESFDPEPWINLAAAAEFKGEVDLAGKYLREADYLAPNLPDYQWPIGNFYLLHGDTTQAFRHFRVILAGSTTKYNQAIFTLAWKASGDAATILRELIPENPVAELGYLYYLMGQGRYADTLPLWKRLMAERGMFPAGDVAGYIDGFISLHEPGNAYEVWTDLQKKGLVRYAAPQPAGNLVTNGDFEDKVLNMGFDWRIASVQGVYAGVDTSDYHSASHALLVAFTGKENVDYRQVFQYILVKPSTAYHLQAYMKTEGITTDSGPRLEVHDAYDSATLDQFTPSMTGDSDGWSPVTLDFRTGPKTELLVLSLTRLPSQKFDNLISGKVWLDDVSVTPLAK